jgi:hypothetical protein
MSIPTKDQLTHPAIMAKGPVVINIKDIQQCFYCHSSPLNNSIAYCPACGFPQFGDEKQQKNFIMDKRMLRMEFEEADDKVQKSRLAIFGVAGILLLNYAILYFNSREDIVLIEGAFLVAVFIGLGIWAGRNAYPASLTALILYGLLIIAYALVDPITIIGGLIWKAIIISSLIYGLKASSEARRLRQKLSSVTFDFGAGAPKN